MSRVLDAYGNIIWQSNRRRYQKERWTNSTSIPSQAHDTRRRGFRPSDACVAEANEIKYQRGLVKRGFIKNGTWHEGMSAKTDG